jgi:hypothetical protein
MNFDLLLFEIVVIEWNDEIGNGKRLGERHLSNKAALEDGRVVVAGCKERGRQLHSPSSLK